MTSPSLPTTLLFFLAYFLLFYTPALAHPMGNFSINHYSKMEVGEDSLRLRYIIDMAEIPTFQELGEIDADGDKNRSPEEEKNYLSGKAEEFKNGFALELNSKPVELVSDSSDMVFIPGAGGLPTIKIALEYAVKLQKSDLVELNRVFYRDDNYPGRAGWKEVIVLGKGGISIASSSAPSEDISDELTNYPADALSSPPQDIQASFSFSLGSQGAGVASIDVRGREVVTQPAGARTPKSLFTELISKKELSPKIILLSLLIAFGLGAFHALSPGHGKTIVAAYLVGSRGTAGHALLLGIIVTLTHTIGVFALGFVTLFASKYIVPEKLYPWLGFASGVVIVVIGMVLFFKRYRAFHGDGHNHGHSHSHPHAHPHNHSHDHEHGHSHHHEIPEKVTFGSLFALGVTGGIIPCPEALIVLLSAISLHRIGYGLVLILAFSIGLALVLMGIGMIMVYARSFIDIFSGEGKITRWLPIVSSVVISVLGFAIAIQSLISGGIIRIAS